MDKVVPKRDERVLDALRASRPGLLHVIDPFKIPLEEAVDKARVLEQFGFPAVLLASTDYENFNSHMTRYARSLRKVTALPLVLHFPPRKAHGYPLVRDVDAAIFPFLFGSKDPYFVWESALETAAVMNVPFDGTGTWPKFIYSAALTFGEDRVCERAMNVFPVEENIRDLSRLEAAIDLLHLDMLYLYSRFSKVQPHTIEYFRRNLSDETVIIASGGVRDRSRVDEYLGAGADYVVFCGALECPQWRKVLDNVLASA